MAGGVPNEAVEGDDGKDVTPEADPEVNPEADPVVSLLDNALSDGADGKGVDGSAGTGGRDPDGGGEVSRAIGDNGTLLLDCSRCCCCCCL